MTDAEFDALEHLLEVEGICALTDLMIRLSKN